MENEESKIKNLWESADPDYSPRENVSFGINEKKIIEFQEDVPTGRISKDGKPFVIWKVIDSGEERQLLTSSMTLISGIKRFDPVKNKKLEIVKKAEGGRSKYFVLKEIKGDDEVKINS